MDAAFPLRHPQTGEQRQGYYRFSRDTLFSLGFVWFERKNPVLAFLNIFIALLTALPLAFCVPPLREMLLSGTSAYGMLGQPLLIGFVLYALLAAVVFFLSLHCILQARALRYGKFPGAAALPLIFIFVLWHDHNYVVLFGDALLVGGMGAFMGFVALLRAAENSNALHSLALMRQGFVALPDPHRDEALIAL